MVTKNQTKLIISLHQKKYRNKHSLFIAEGIKVIQELINSKLQLHEIYCTNKTVFEEARVDFQLISEKELKKISALTTPNNALALFKIPEPQKIDTNGLILVLDDIRDPGNLGTIIRLCDWFGIKDLVCSNETVDCYNTKVVQATMGSLARVNITYTDISDFIKNSDLPSYAATMNGTNVYKSSLPSPGILVMGNESNGVSEKVQEIIDHQITIPRFGDLKKTESLNVATATAIMLSEFSKNFE
ncbi:RNA methyltransferase [Flavobacteriaceae bacterium R38]|nr:RNA methyltransferase [Flavobacteriaceae bacterium R38]